MTAFRQKSQYRVRGDIKIVNFEGMRGVGKTSVLKLVTSALLRSGIKISTNRTSLNPVRYKNLHVIKSHKVSSPYFKRTLEIQKEWEENFTETASEVLEELIWKKIELGLNDLRTERDMYKKYREKSDLLLLDRDLDTTVAYGVAELVVSNRRKYRTKRDISRLVNKVGGLIYNTRELPDITYYLINRSGQDALKRSWQTKKDSKQEFVIDERHEQIQELIPMIYESAFEYRRKLFPEKKILYVTTDGNSVKELGEILLRLMCAEEIPTPVDDYVKLRRWNPQDKIKTLRALISCIRYSTTGAALPAKWEVVQNNVSNCVYSNSALVSYANALGLGTFQFCAVENETRSNTCPVHWCVLETKGNKGRVIDITPFTSVKFGTFGDLKKDDHNITILGREGDVVYDRLLVEDKRYAYDLMEFANKTQYSEHPEKHIKEGFSLLKLSKNSSAEIFLTVRIIRSLHKGGDVVLATKLLNQLIGKYPGNMVVSRELARLILSDELELKKPFKLALKKAVSTFNYAKKNMSAFGYKKGDIESFANYYEWVVQAYDKLCTKD